MRYAISLILIGFGLASGSAALAASPSFNCNRAQTTDEFAICDDVDLSRLDRILNSNYNMALAQSGPRVTDIARGFTRRRNACGPDRACIRQIQINAILAMRNLGGTYDVPTDLIPSLPGAVPTTVTESNTTSQQQMQVIVQNGNQAETAELKRQVALLQDAVRAQTAKTSAPPPVADEAITGTDEELASLSATFDKASDTRSLYPTPIRPNDQDLGQTARKASERFPHVPFYIPGTRESGRFWVEPRVTDNGVLVYDLTFVDPGASVDRRRAVIDLSGDDLERMKLAVGKLREWSEVAHKNGIRRSYRKRVDCFPNADCPKEGEKLDGHASTEIIFIVNEDGSTAGRIQRNKGRFDEGYNVSINSAVLLRSYLRYVQSRGEREFIAGSRTTDDLNRMFK